jgi:hypothetical protein
MFGIESKVLPQVEKVQKAADKATFKSFKHAAFAIRKSIRESIVKSPDPSSPGQPVATRGKRGNVKNSIFVYADEDGAIIGPRASFVGDAMAAHEFGQERGGRQYDKRPTSAPGLEKNLGRFANEFAGSIGE